MIPQLKKNGYLPKGLFKATINKISEKFGLKNPIRKKLQSNLSLICKLLKRNKRAIKSFFVDGSYVTDKENPNDVDCLLVFKSDYNLSTKDTLILSNAEKLYKIHIFIVEESEKMDIQTMYDFFSNDREQNKKGLIEVIL